MAESGYEIAVALHEGVAAGRMGGVVGVKPVLVDEGANVADDESGQSTSSGGVLLRREEIGRD